MSQRDTFLGGIAPGERAADAEVERHGEPIRLLDCLTSGPTGLYFANPDGSLAGGDGETLSALSDRGVRPLVVLPPFCPFVGEAVQGRLLDQSGIAHERYDARPGTFYLIGGDGQVMGRWRRLSMEEIDACLARP